VKAYSKVCDFPEYSMIFYKYDETKGNTVYKQQKSIFSNEYH